MKKHGRRFHFLKTYRNLDEVLTDHELASLGDEYVNFVYSLALSNRKRSPSGGKVKGLVLAKALKKAGLRKYMPPRITRHVLADAGEALAVYAWLNQFITLEESVAILEKTDNLIEGFSQLFLTIKDRIRF